MKILLDMNLSPEWIDVLAGVSIEAVHWRELGLASDSDHVIMEHAATHGYTVLTQDLDFGILLMLRRRSSPSVVQIRSDDTMPSVIGHSVVQAILRLEEELEHGALVTVEPTKTRLRLLAFDSEDDVGR